MYYELIDFIKQNIGARKRSWLRHYVTSRKIAGSITDEVTEFLNWSNFSNRNMALGSTQAQLNPQYIGRERY
jgi:hypothetical protein